MMSIVPTLTAVLIFSIYNNTSNKKLSVAKTYSILIIFNMLSYPIMSLILFF
jgi:ABC-type bacteriocin/lantibiotic exporter with double-glycine peptidase domain